MKTTIKKILVLSSLILAFLSVTNLLSANPVYADSYFTGNCNNFIGFTSWDCGVDVSDSESLKQGIWQIVTNISTDITVLAAYLILGYVIYGGYLYMFSSGEASKVSAGKKTLLHAFIGLAIVMTANIIMNTIRVVLVSNGKMGDCVTTNCVNPGDMIMNIIGWVVAISGLVAVIFLIYGGILYITSTGDASKVKKAKDTILYAIIGLIIVALAQIISAFVAGAIRNSSENASIEQNSIIAITKEINSQ